MSDDPRTEAVESAIVDALVDTGHKDGGYCFGGTPNLNEVAHVVLENIRACGYLIVEADA